MASSNYRREPPSARDASVSAFQTSGGALRKRWRKVLYQRQPFADNHVDESFLAQLVTNANVVDRSYWSMVKSTANVTQEILIVLFFCTIFKLTHDVVGAPPTAIVEKGGVIVAHTDQTQGNGFVSSLHQNDRQLEERWLFVLVLLDAATLILGFALQLALWPSDFTMHNIGQAVKNLVLFFVIILVISPVLRTLTKSFSDDTIYALTIWLFGVHLVFYDYSFAETFWFYGTMSLNAAIFASVLLASRLTSDSHSFAIVTFAISLFGVFPIFRHAMHLYSYKYHIGLTVFMFVIVWFLLEKIAHFLVVIYVTTTLLITFAAPGVFISLQKLKREITGPWDIAKLEPSANRGEIVGNVGGSTMGRTFNSNRRSLSMTTLSKLSGTSSMSR